MNKALTLVLVLALVWTMPALAGNPTRCQTYPEPMVFSSYVVQRTGPGQHLLDLVGMRPTYLRPREGSPQDAGTVGLC
jgi:hypothetical protein